MEIVSDNESVSPAKRLGRKPYSDREMVRKFTACRLAPKTISFIEEVQSGMNPKKKSVGRAIDRIVEALCASGVQIRPEV